MFNLFNRTDETIKTHELLFFWTRNDQLVKSMRKIENRFWELFNDIKVHQDKCIDESSSVWPGEVKK